MIASHGKPIRAEVISLSIDSSKCGFRIVRWESDEHAKTSGILPDKRRSIVVGTSESIEYFWQETEHAHGNACLVPLYHGAMNQSAWLLIFGIIPSPDQ